MTSQATNAAMACITHACSGLLCPMAFKVNTKNRGHTAKVLSHTCTHWQQEGLILPPAEDIHELNASITFINRSMSLEMLILT